MLESEKKLGYGWMLFAVFSLVFAGIFAFLVAMARTPYIEDILPLGGDYIYVALVGHVILAVVIWFLAFEGFMWVLTSTVHLGQPQRSPLLGWLSLASASLGTALIVITAIFGLGEAELANYVPILIHPLFYTGLALFAAGIVLNLVNTFGTLLKARAEWKTEKKERKPFPILTLGMAAAAVAVAVAFICFGLSGFFQFITGKAFFDLERFFWGGGHVLQFANTIAMVTVWVYLARLTLGREPIGRKAAVGAYLYYLAFVAAAPFVYFIHDTATQAYKELFTEIMRWGLGPPTMVFVLAVVYMLVTKKGTEFEGRALPWGNPGFSSLVLSMAVFMLGGVLALMISGVNTIIPAHYHCVIGAVTIAFMGLFYEVLPLLNRSIYSKRMAKIQPYLYSLGIVLFAAGLFIAGTHGVQRKTYGAEQNLDTIWKTLGMGIMGVGGLVAIAGGITFVWNALLSLLRRPLKCGESGEGAEGGEA
ncbi:MAG: cbb3-type cytochrome c oxidase subunit I [Thermodesulfobacteriota bacterium]